MLKNNDFKYGLYSALCALFVVTIITNNLIYQKFISINLFYKFEISAGVLTYPLTFFIMEIITEIYGSNLAKICLKLSIYISLFIALLIFGLDHLEAASWSKLDNDTFHFVFGNYSIALFSSLLANYIAQTFDIKLYSYLRQLTEHRYYWVRGISSSIAMLADVVIINLFLSLFGIVNISKTINLIIDSYIYKLLFTILITPFFKPIISRLKLFICL